MNATSDSLAVVEARLPYTDRGSFSQAWFSALHLAGDARGSAPLARPHRPLDASARVASDAKHAASGVAREMQPNARRTESSSSTRSGRLEAQTVAGSRECVRVKSTRAPISSPAHPLEPFRATLCIDGVNARVHLFMRRAGDTIHIIALCSEKNAGLVRRALACAERELAANGNRIATGVRTFEGSAA